jgi:hypothetical protein
LLVCRRTFAVETSTIALRATACLAVIVSIVVVSLWQVDPTISVLSTPPTYDVDMSEVCLGTVGFGLFAAALALTLFCSGVSLAALTATSTIGGTTTMVQNPMAA